MPQAAVWQSGGGANREQCVLSGRSASGLRAIAGPQPSCLPATAHWCPPDPYSRRLSRIAIAGLGPLSHDGGTDTAFELGGAFVPPKLAPSEAPEPNGHRRGHVLRDETGGGFREQGTVARAPNVWRAIC